MEVYFKIILGTTKGVTCQSVLIKTKAFLPAIDYRRGEINEEDIIPFIYNPAKLN